MRQKGEARLLLQKPVRPDFKKVLIGLLLAAVLILVLDLGCVFRRVTGVPCPGCGMTRAHLVALSLDFGRAFYYHPLWPLPALLFLAQIFFPAGIFRSRRLNSAAAIGLLVLVLGVYLVRMLRCFPDTPPMEYQSQSILGWLLARAGLLT